MVRSSYPPMPNPSGHGSEIFSMVSRKCLPRSALLPAPIRLFRSPGDRVDGYSFGFRSPDERAATAFLPTESYNPFYLGGGIDVFGNKWNVNRSYGKSCRWCGPAYPGCNEPVA